MIKRPDRAETEEDLLRLQEEYRSQKQKPSVSVKTPSKNTNRGEEKGNEEQKIRGERIYFDVDELEDAAKRLDDKEKDHVSSVLSDIKEKDISRMTQSPRVFPRNFKTGFPTAPVLDKDLLQSQNNMSSPSTSKTKTKKKSLFARQFARSKDTPVFGEQSRQPVVIENMINDNDGEYKALDVLAEKDRIYSDELPPKVDPSSMSRGRSTEKEGIEKENRRILNEMSEQEILQEREKLLKTLDPKLVAFLQKSGKSKSSTADGDTSKPPPVGVDNQLPIEEEREETSIERPSKESCNEDGSEDGSEDVDPHEEFGIGKGYVNMNVVEKDKLQWMKRLPKVHTKKEQATPRFDFEGNLLSPDDEIDVSLGLHHHGNEPELAGYSLEELFQMIRSNFAQQRVFGLEMLARIIEKYHAHMFVGRLSADLLVQCLDAGLLFLLRWSLDEQAEQIYSAALFGLACLVHVKKDQALAEKLFYTKQADGVHGLCTFYKKKKTEMTKEEREGDRDLTDAELMERDVVQALLQMQVLPRLRYLITVCPTSKSGVKNCLFILIRIAQHSSDCAYQIFKCTGLISAVMNVFRNDAGSCNEEIELQVLKLIRCLCVSGKSICQNLIASHSLLGLITREFCSMKVTSELSHALCKRFSLVCHVWRVLLLYDTACDLVSELHMMVMKHLQATSSSYALLDDALMTSIVMLIGQVFVSCGERKKFNWSVVDGFFPVLQYALKNIRQDLCQNEKVTHPLYLSALLRCCQQYFTSWNVVATTGEKPNLMDDIAKFWKENLQIILSSDLLSKLLVDARDHSDFQPSHKKADTAMCNGKITNLPMYGSHAFVGGESPASLSAESPLCLVQAVLETIIKLTKINRQFLPKLTAILISPDVLAYLKTFLDFKQEKRGGFLHIWMKIELTILHHFLVILYHVSKHEGFDQFPGEVKNIYLQVASHLVCLFHASEKEFVGELLQYIIFNERMLSNQQTILWLPAVYTQQNQLDINILLAEARKMLPKTADIYLSLLFCGKERYGVLDDGISTLMTSSFEDNAMPSDWMFLPIVQLYNHSMELELSGRLISKASREAIDILKNSLQFVLLLETTKASLLADVNEMLRLTRVMCVFMTEGNLYKEDCLRDVLRTLVTVYCAPTFVCYLNLEEKIPGVTSFYDLYSTLVNEYISSSFADHTFANILLIPMQVRFDVRYRKCIWMEHVEILRVFPIPLNKVTCDVRMLLASEREDVAMIDIYFQTLMSSISTRCCPLFYLIAVHHVSQFIFDNKIQDGMVDKKAFVKRRHLMLKQITCMRDTAIRDDIVYYKSFDVNSVDVVTKFAQLPPSREIFLRQLRLIDDSPS